MRKRENVYSLPGANGNAYSSSKRLYEAIKATKDNIIAYDLPIKEAIDWEVGDKEKGGIIVLSTDVNAVEVSDNKFINAIKKIARTFKNRISYNKKIDAVANKHNLIGWTVGKFLSGRYRAKNGVNFGENSLSVEIIGVSTDDLIDIAEDLCEEFSQETVLVKDYSTGKIFFVNSEK